MIERIARARPSERIRRIRPAIIQPTGPSILDAIADPRMFKPWFRDPASWSAWMAFLCALFCLPMTAEQLETYRKHTGRTDPPSTIARAAFLICGRRAGKSFLLAVTAVFLACFYDYRQYLVPGERGRVLVIARDREQAQVIFGYIRALMTKVSILARLLESPPIRESIHLTNGVSIQVASANFKSVRGRTTVAALIDELAYFPTDESAEPDVELLAAIKPSMLTIPNSMLLVASSPYARKGELWRAYKEYYGKDGSTLVWKATTREMNPLVPQEEIDADIARDPARYTAEYMAEFRSDIESYIQREAVEACVSAGVFERPYVRGVRYTAFVDPAGGSGGGDSMTCAVAMKDGDGAILVALRERSGRFSPDEVVAEFCGLLRQYNITKVIGDKWGGEFVREPFLRHGVIYEPSARTKSDLYADFLSLLNSGRADLLDNEKLINQIASLERRLARGGKSSIDHPPGAHDDLANVVAGSLVNLVVSKSSYTLDFVCADRDEGNRFNNAVDRVASLESMMTARFW